TEELFGCSSGGAPSARRKGLTSADQIDCLLGTHDEGALMLPRPDPALPTNCQTQWVAVPASQFEGSVLVEPLSKRRNLRLLLVTRKETFPPSRKQRDGRHEEEAQTPIRWWRSDGVSEGDRESRTVLDRG